MPENFVSVSGVVDESGLGGIASICCEEGFSFPVVIGYQVSNKSINHDRKNARQPIFQELGELGKQTRDHGLVTALHYYTKSHNTVLKDLERCADVGVDPEGTLVQFNTLPPPLDILEEVKKRGYRVILEVAVSDKSNSGGGYAVWKGPQVEDVNSGSAANLIGQVVYRREFIDYAMFDASHGTNLGLDLNSDSLAINFGRFFNLDFEIAMADIGLVYAGGVGPDNVRYVTKTLDSFFPNGFSIDTESKVRIDDKLKLDLVRDYLVGYGDAMES